MNNKELYLALEEWFKLNLTNERKYYNTKIGKLIRESVYQDERWKAWERGDPAKGMKVYLRNKARREGYDVEPEDNDNNYEE